MLTVTCSPQPQEHLLQYWLDYKGPGDEYSRLTPHAISAISEYRIPGPKGFSRTVTGPCVKGYYRTHYITTGTGPDGIPFDIEDTGWSKLLTSRTARGERMMQQRTYAEYVPPRGLAWIWWTLQRSLRMMFQQLRRTYRRSHPLPEVSRYVGLSARVIGENRLLPPVGSVGVVARSEVRHGDRVYIIEFEDMTLIAGLPAPRILELISRD